MSESQKNIAPYSTSANQQVASTANQQHMTTGQWIITMLLLSIPLLNLILLFVWAFSKGTSPDKRNYSRASLIIGAIGLAVLVLITIMLPLASALSAQS